MFNFIDQPIRVYYYINGIGTDLGPAKFDQEWWCNWLDGMVTDNEDVIFFLTVESTDVFEKEWDFNTVVMGAENGEIAHTYSPECPEGCRGQMEGCAYAPDTMRTHVNDAFNHGRHDEPMFYEVGVEHAELTAPDGEKLDFTFPSYPPDGTLFKDLKPAVVQFGEVTMPFEVFTSMASTPSQHIWIFDPKIGKPELVVIDEDDEHFYKMIEDYGERCIYFFAYAALIP